jgi:hypothetical protein
MSDNSVVIGNTLDLREMTTTFWGLEIADSVGDAIVPSGTNVTLVRNGACPDVEIRRSGPSARPLTQFA